MKPVGSVRTRNHLVPIGRAVLLLPAAIACAHGTAQVPRLAPDAAAVAPSTAPVAQRAPASPGDLAPGARVRFHLRDDWRGLRTGNVARATADTVWLTSGLALPVHRLRRLDLSQGGTSEERRMGRGALIGASLGAIAGAFMRPEGSARDGPRTSAGTVALGGMIGMAYGGLAGAFVPGERWERVALPAVSR